MFFPFHSSWFFPSFGLYDSCYYLQRKTRMKQKKCRYCRTSFIPNPRVGKRQKTCGKPACKKALKAENNARWTKENPACCQNDYPRVKQWLDEHPDYLTHYRQTHPEYVQRNREARKLRYRRKKLYVDIQAQIKDQLPEITEKLWNQPFVDIQASIKTQPNETTFLFSSFPCFDIQVQMDRSPCRRENGAILSRR